jgi:hypothetical protein
MKNFVFALLAVAIAFMPAAAQADTVTIGETLSVSGGFGLGGGSVFKVTESEGNVFDSFCLELGEPISAGNYEVKDVTQTAYLGGVGIAGDPISNATAWLYLQYRSGNPSYAPFAFAVQQAIWVLEGELLNCPAGKCGTFVTDAVNNGTAADLAKVFVINFGPKPGETSPKVQDLLTTTVPDGGATLMLLGGALVGIGALRRKFRR